MRKRLLSTALLLLGFAAGAGSPWAQTTGLIPLSDLGAGTHQGFQGGLYPGGVNHPPSAHFTAAMQKAASIVPRDAAGSPDPLGLIGMIAVGMSNTTHEFGAFERNQDRSQSRNARVVLMDTAYGGQTAAAIADPTAAYWTTMTQRLTAMKLTAAQVQVAWLKEADAQPPDNFPTHAIALRNELELIANNLHDKFPNLQLCYLSSRVYGGYAAPGSLNPEPQAYESGFSVKWLIEDQINGDTGLNYGQLGGTVRAPLLLWGPYLWADGTTPRSDGLTWLSSDFEADFTHPGPTGEQKVAGLLSNFFASDATAGAWWPARTDTGLVTIDAIKDAHVGSASPNANFGTSTSLLEQGGASTYVSYLGFNVSGVARPVALAKLSLRVLAGGGGVVSTVNDTSWSETTITFNNAPLVGAALINMPQSTRDGTVAANVTGNVNADADGLVSYALSTTSTAQFTYRSRQDGEAPRLTMLVSCAAGADTDGDGHRDTCDCAPQDASAAAVPQEVHNVYWINGTTLAWDSEAALAGNGTAYDIMSGVLADLHGFGAGGGDLCVGSGLPVTQAGDTTPGLNEGEGRYFLVRAVNACGRSRWEISSDGQDRAVAACP